jgi:hypothetical protein
MVADTMALPVATAVMVPPLTVAMPAFDVVQVTVELLTGCPAASETAAATETLLPTFTVTAAGERLILAGADDAADGGADEFDDGLVG